MKCQATEECRNFGDIVMHIAIVQLSTGEAISRTVRACQGCFKESAEIAHLFAAVQGGKPRP